MAFSSDLAALVAGQLERFVTLAPHQLAGQVANLDFWLAQVRNAIDTIDGYGVRFVRLEAAQTNAAARTGGAGPYRVPDRELQKSRRAVAAAAERFLARCREAGLLSDAEHSAAAARGGLSDAPESAWPR